MCNCIFCLTSGGAQCCAIWSFMSVLFLIFAGLVMSTPPVFIKDMSAEQAKTGAHNAFVVAGMYGATLFIAIFMYMHRSRQEKTALGKSSAKTNTEVGLGDDTFSAPLVESAGGATSASAETRASSERGTSSGKKKKSKVKTGEALTSI